MGTRAQVPPHVFVFRVLLGLGLGRADVVDGDGGAWVLVRNARQDFQLVGLVDGLYAPLGFLLTDLHKIMSLTTLPCNSLVEL